VSNKYDIPIFITPNQNVPSEPILFTKKGTTPPRKIAGNEKTWQNAIIDLLSNKLSALTTIKRGCSFLAAARSGINLQQVKTLLTNDIKEILPWINQIAELETDPITDLNINSIQTDTQDPTSVHIVFEISQAKTGRSTLQVSSVI